MAKPQTSAAEFGADLAELVAQLKADIAAHQSGLDPSPAARAARRRRVLVAGDFQFFAYTYFPHHVRGTPSLFQAHFCGRFPQVLRLAGGATEWWIAPRGEAKSSLLTKIGPTWCAVQGLLQQPAVRAEVGWPEDAPLPPFVDYIILLGAETKLPTKLLEVVKTELVFNAALARDFPEACGRGPIWRVGEFVTRSGVKVEPFGAEQAIRGTFHGASRPKLLLGDDLITDSEAKSPTERNNRWEWLTKAIDYLGPPDGSVKFLGVGTVLNKDDPISRARRTIGHVVHHFRAIAMLPQRMDLWERCQEIMLNDDLRAQEDAAARGQVLPDPQGLPSFAFYQAHQALMDAGAVVSWPEVRSLFWLMRQRAKAPRAFGTEMQGEPRDEADKVFTPVQFWVNRLAEWVFYGGCDPSMGRGETSDPSAILVGGYSRDSGQLAVVEAAIKRRVPSKLEADLIALQAEYRCLAIGFENNNAYEHSRQTFVKAAAAKGVALPLVGITAAAPPEVRIESLEPFITDAMAPRIVFAPYLTQLLAELDAWPEAQAGHHFDGLSALYMLWQVATRGHGRVGISTRPRQPRPGLAGPAGSAAADLKGF
ncbi:MAG: phage terminase large subunit [Burkholderiaceae bacterium]|nr:phage terminase large subunit [Burkholderiaceae bacterium]